MRKTFLNPGKPLAAAGIAAALFLFPAPAWGQDIIPATPSGNNVNVQSDVSGSVYGGKATGSASSNGNTVTITGGHINVINGNVYGGCTEDQDAKGNTVKVTNARVDGIIFGGHVDKGTGPTIHANNNSVILGPGADIRDNVYGAYTNANGEVVGNSVIIDGAAVGHGSAVIAGGYSNSGSSPVSGNSVTINSGNIQSTNISGGRGQSTTINGNKVTINGGTITGTIHGGERLNGFNTPGTVDNNSVSITGGTVNGSVYGGYSNHSQPTSANNNSVSITGGTVTGNNIYGGFSATGTATGNTVTLGGSPTLTGSNLFGSNNPAFTGNLLQLMEYKSNSTLASVQNFDSYRFCLPPSLAYGYLEATSVNFTGPSGTFSKVTEVHIMTKGDTVKPADGKIYLIKAGGFTGTISNITNNKADMNVMQGTTLYYSGTLQQDTNALYLNNVSGPQVNPPAQAIVKGSNTGTVPMLNQGANLVVGPGLSEAVEATSEAFEAEAVISEAEAVSEECLKRGRCLKSFTALSGGHLRYNKGAADMDSVSILTGLARGVDLPAGRLTLGGFLEYGFGNYSTYGYYTDVINNGPDLFIEGEGLAWHLGGGLLGRLNFTGGAGGSHPYVEGSLRAGEMQNYYNHLYPDKIMNQWEQVEFDTSAPYYGAHLGLGYLWNLSGATSLDSSVKYLWARQEGDSVNLKPFGDPIKFGAVTSQRLLAGLRLSHAVNAKVRPYVGAAYDYEFDSESRATTHGLSIDSHSVRGGTKIGEVGLSFKPDPTRLVTLDFGLQGYTGMKEGITGSMQLKVEF